MSMGLGFSYQDARYEVSECKNNDFYSVIGAFCNNVKGIRDVISLASGILSAMPSISAWARLPKLANAFSYMETHNNLELYRAVIEVPIAPVAFVDLRKEIEDIGETGANWYTASKVVSVALDAGVTGIRALSLACSIPAVILDRLSFAELANDIVDLGTCSIELWEQNKMYGEVLSTKTGEASPLKKAMTDEWRATALKVAKHSVGILIGTIGFSLGIVAMASLEVVKASLGISAEFVKNLSPYAINKKEIQVTQIVA